MQDELTVVNGILTTSGFFGRSHPGMPLNDPTMVPVLTACDRARAQIIRIIIFAARVQGTIITFITHAHKLTGRRLDKWELEIRIDQFNQK